MHHVSCRVFLVKHQIIQVTQPPYCPDLATCNFWLFPKLKSPSKGKRFQTIDEIQENTRGSWWWLDTCVWSQGAYFEGDCSVIVLCTRFLVSCILFNKYLYFLTPWLDTFWTDFMCLAGPMVLWDLFYSLSSYATRRSTGGNHEVSDENFAPLKLIASLCTETL